MGIQQTLSRWGDVYDREARLYPGLLTILPVLAIFLCNFGAKQLLLMSAVSLLLASGGPLLLARTARDLGKALEDRLFEKWGGKPSTIILRHRDTTIDAITKKQYHGVIALGIEKSAPTKSLEEKNPDQADIFYRAGTAWLISKTQDTKKHPLVFRESRHYGFQRNMRGLKWIGIVLSLVTLMISILHFYLQSDPTLSPARILSNVTIVEVLPVVISLAMLLYWVFLVTEESVRRAGFSYADRLIRACDTLATKPKRQKAD